MLPQARDRSVDTSWKLAYRVFEDALDLPPQERGAFARSATEDPEVLRLVLDLIGEAELELAGDDESPGELDLPAGARFGHYEIGEKLGRGGMGEVYSALDPELGRMVALKLLAPGVAVTPKAVERLIREAKAASALNHPNIVTVYGLVRQDTKLALAMEFVEGEALRRYCGQAQPVNRVIHSGRQVAKALAATHERGVVHRDIKPENLMIRADGVIKLLDFGLARQSLSQGTGAESNLTGILAGTFNYMSPEQTTGRPVGGASDVFSLGIVLYELTTGSHPFRSGSAIDTAQAIAHKDPKPPRALEPSTPPALNTLLLDMLHKNPNRRPTAKEVDRRLEEIGPAAAPPRRRLPAIAAASLVVCVAAGLALVKMRDQLAPARTPKLMQITRQDIDNGAAEAALSPDGANLAFATESGAIQLHRMRDGFTRKLNAPPDFRIDRIAWFPDGKRLLISGSRDLEQRPDIWVISTGSGAPRHILANFTNGIPSPDGARIAVTNAGGTAIWVTDSSGESPRYVRGGGATTAFTSLIWSPDGKRVAYDRQEYSPPRDRQADSRSSELEKNFAHTYESVEVESGRVVAAAPGVMMVSACSLPNGRVLFLRWTKESASDREVWELRTDPRSGRLLGSARALTRGGTLPLVVSISATNDGKQIALVNYTGSIPRIKVADLPPAGAPMRFLNVRTLTSSNDYPHAWTPDSRAVIFESARSGNFNLYSQALDESEAKPLVVSRGENVLAQLSPDGKWVLYRSTENGVRRLMRVPLRGGRPEPVPIQGAWDEFRCPSGPGKPCVLRTIENDQFIFHELDPVRGRGGELGRTVWNPTLVGDWDISPEADEAAIPDHEMRQAKIRFLPLGKETRGMEETTLTLAGPERLFAVQWAVDGEGWFVTVGRANTLGGGDVGYLVYVDRKGGASVLARSRRPLYAVPSPDGRHVAFPDMRIRSNAYLVQGL
ncbi:MAG: protein kinase [Acidobacteriaceae bacterium]|nr:protein kinase [Acidobacteriaceae bacterium]